MRGRQIERPVIRSPNASSWTRMQSSMRSTFSTIALSNSEHEADWNAWYETFLVKLVSVPGFKTAQRFQGQSPYSSPYLALYSVTSRAVFDSQPYRDIGGG